MMRYVFCFLVAALVTDAEAACPYSRTLTFAGHNWCVKAAKSQVGPGPNYFSDSTNNVWLDNMGRLHLKIYRSGSRWYCAEVVSEESFGYGTYRFYIDSPVDKLDPNIIFGLFTRL